MEENKTPQAESAPVQEHAAAPVQQPKPASTKKGMPKWAKWLIGVVIVAILGVGGYCLYNCLKSGDSTKPDMSLIPVCQKDKWGYIDKDGAYVINPQFKYAEYFSDGLARVLNEKGKLGYINKKGEFVIPAQYLDGTFFKEGLAFVVSEGGAPVCIDKKGNTVFEMSQADGVVAFSEGLALFYKNDKDGNPLHGFVDKKGKVVINPQFNSAECFSEGLALVGVSGKDGEKSKHGFIDKQGKYVINPQFDAANSFSEGMAAIEMDGKWGFIDKKGKYVVNPQFDYVQPFKGGVAAVCQDDKWGYIDKKGKFTINPQFESAYGFWYGESLAPVVSDDKCGYIDKEGKYAINPQFDGETDFVDGIAAVKSGQKWGVINKKGEYVVNPQFDRIGFPYLIYGYIKSDYYNCSDFLNAFLKGFDSGHVSGLAPNACRKNVPAATDNKSYSGSDYIKSNPETKLDNNITLSEVEYFFKSSDDDDEWDYSYDNDAPLTGIRYSFELNSTALQKVSTIGRRLSEKLKSIYGGRVLEYKDAYDCKHILVCSKNFYFQIVTCCGGMIVMAICDKSMFEELESDFTESMKAAEKGESVEKESYSEYAEPIEVDASPTYDDDSLEAVAEEEYQEDDWDY